MNKTKIDYLDYTWNPLAMRCTPVSEGCRNCWHLAMAKRLAKNHTIDRDAQRAYSDIDGPSMNYVELEAPLHLRKSARIGVQFMGDLFHESIKREQTVEIVHIMRQSQKHTFFLLTKRPERMKNEWILACKKLNMQFSPANVWLGVSVEDQKTADERIPILLQIPAAHRWVSVEPMLGAVDLKSYLFDRPCPACEGKNSDLCEYLDIENRERCVGGWIQSDMSEPISWVICGGETGPGARPLDPEWVRSLRDQCIAAGIPFFFKNWGDYNKKAKDIPEAIGHLLDGKEWREIPNGTISGFRHQKGV